MCGCWWGVDSCVCCCLVNVGCCCCCDSYVGFGWFCLFLLLVVSVVRLLFVGSLLLVVWVVYGCFCCWLGVWWIVCWCVVCGWCSWCVGVLVCWSFVGCWKFIWCCCGGWWSGWSLFCSFCWIIVCCDSWWGCWGIGCVLVVGGCRRLLFFCVVLVWWKMLGCDCVWVCGRLVLGWFVWWWCWVGSVVSCLVLLFWFGSLVCWIVVLLVLVLVFGFVGCCFRRLVGILDSCNSGWFL